MCYYQPDDFVKFLTSDRPGRTAMAPRPAHLNMDLADLLQEKRDLLVDRWFEAVAQTYPADTARFLKDNADQFSFGVCYLVSVTQDLVGPFAELYQ